MSDGHFLRVIRRKEVFALAFGAMIALGHWVLRPLFHVVAAGRSAEIQLSYTEIRAPFAGVVVAKNAQPGEMVSPVSAGGGLPRAVSGGTFQDQKAEAERSIIIAALERNGWQITKTAADLGLADHSSLLKIMRRHGLKR